jgi:DNA-binding MarR family transcriptional regulator
MSSPPDPAARLVEVLPAVERALARWAHSLIDTSGSSLARVRLLGVLHCKGPQIMADLGCELGVTARQVTNLVDALERERLVRRAAHPTDRRATVIEITPAGAEQAEQLWQPFRDQLTGLYREMPEADQRELLRLLEALLDTLRRKSQGVAPQPGLRRA